jgi:hypothetical protein
MSMSRTLVLRRAPKTRAHRTHDLRSLFPVAPESAAGCRNAKQSGGNNDNQRRAARSPHRGARCVGACAGDELGDAQTSIPATDDVCLTGRVLFQRGSGGSRGCAPRSACRGRRLANPKHETRVDQTRWAAAAPTPTFGGLRARKPSRCLTLRYERPGMSSARPPRTRAPLPSSRSGADPVDVPCLVNPLMFGRPREKTPLTRVGSRPSHALAGAHARQILRARLGCAPTERARKRRRRPPRDL